MVGFQMDEGSREIAELLKNAKLNHRIPASKVDELTQIHVVFRRCQLELVASLQAGRITPDEYMANFNSALREAMKANEQVLGRDFESVFGSAGHAPEGLIEPETFYSESRSSQAKFGR
jgi:hypothetical protein